MSQPLELPSIYQLRITLREISPLAQFIAVCSASNLAEARCISSLLQGSSLAKTRAFSRPSRAHGHHLRPSTNCEKLSEVCFHEIFVALPMGTHQRIGLDLHLLQDR